jgi:predicted transcriptional regulator
MGQFKKQHAYIGDNLRIDELKRLYVDEEMSLREIEMETGTPKSTLSRILRQYKIERPNVTQNTKKHKLLVDQVNHLFQEGNDIDFISTKLQISEQTVVFCLKELGYLEKTNFHALRYY